MVELGEPVQGGREVIWRFRLEFATGWSASTVGHALYNKDNPRGTYGDALETCKSDALVRAVKDLGFGTVLLNREWKEGWKSQHCRLVYRCEEMKLRWRRNDATPYPDEGMPDRDPGPTYHKQLDYHEEIRQRWEILTARDPDRVRMARAEQEEWNQAAQDPWEEMTEADRLAAEDELFNFAAREDE